MGDESSLGAAEDDVSAFHIAGDDRLHRNQLPLSDAGIHASPGGPEAHAGTTAQKLSREIKK